jgi:hypothetical protein
MFKRLLPVLLAAVPLLAVSGYAVASDERSAAAQAASATAAFHDLEAAQAAGYTVHVQELSGATCIATAPSAPWAITSPTAPCWAIKA